MLGSWLEVKGGIRMGQEVGHYVTCIHIYPLIEVWLSLSYSRVKYRDLKCKFNEFKCVYGITKSFLKIYVFKSLLMPCPYQFQPLTHSISGNHSSDSIQHLNEFLFHTGSLESWTLLYDFLTSGKVTSLWNWCIILISLINIC